MQRTLADSPEFDQELARCYRDGQLHQAVSSNTAPTLAFELNYLRNISEKILAVLLPHKDSKSKILNCLFREILSCRLLQPLVDQLSDPDTINQVLVYIAQQLAQDSKHFLSLEESGIIDQKSNPFESDTSTFNDLLVQVNICDSLLDAFGLRDSIETEIMQKRAEISLRYTN